MHKRLVSLCLFSMVISDKSVHFSGFSVWNEKRWKYHYLFLSHRLECTFVYTLLNLNTAFGPCPCLPHSNIADYSPLALPRKHLCRIHFIPLYSVICIYIPAFGTVHIYLLISMKWLHQLHVASVCRVHSFQVEWTDGSYDICMHCMVRWYQLFIRCS